MLSIIQIIPGLMLNKFFLAFWFGRNYETKHVIREINTHERDHMSQSHDLKNICDGLTEIAFSISSLMSMPHFGGPSSLV